MKKIVLFVAVAVVALLSQAAFAADNTGVYVGISGGYVIPSTMTLTDPDDSSNHLDATLKNGYLGGVKAGWNTPFTKRIMAMELEYNYISNAFDKDKVLPDFWAGAATMDGTISINSLLFNLKARYPEGKFHPYVGVGVGWSLFQVGDITVREFGGTGIMNIEGKSGSALAYQFLAGLDFDITPNFGVGIGYKYFATKPTVGERTDGIYAEFDYKASIVTLGLTYTF